MINEEDHTSGFRFSLKERREEAESTLLCWVAQRKTGEHQARELKTQEFVRKRSMALGSSTAAGGRKGKGEGPGNQNLAEALARAPSLVLEPRPLDEQDYSFKTEVIAGICAGVVQVLLFNPYDRALYLSSIHQRPFLHTKQKRSEERNHATIPSITSGLVTNYLSLVKYRQYQRDIQKPLLHDVRRIFYKDLATLTRGLGATVARDSVFGSVFTSLRVLF
eukprot:g8916.t1